MNLDLIHAELIRIREALEARPFAAGAPPAKPAPARSDEVPMTQTEVHHAKPIYEYLPGWTEDISGAQTLADLPQNARDYVAFLEEVSKTRISAVGVGQDRNATIAIHDLIN